MRLVIAEKPSVAQSIAAVLGAKSRHDGYLEGSGYVVSWCFGQNCVRPCYRDVKRMEAAPCAL